MFLRYCGGSFIVVDFWLWSGRWMEAAAGWDQVETDVDHMKVASQLMMMVQPGGIAEWWTQWRRRDAVVPATVRDTHDDPVRTPTGWNNRRRQSSLFSQFSRDKLESLVGALKMQDRKMTDKDIAGGGKCRTGIWRTKVQGWKMTDKNQVVKNYSTAVYPTPHPSATTSRCILFYLSI